MGTPTDKDSDQTGSEMSSNRLARRGSLGAEEPVHQPESVETLQFIGRILDLEQSRIRLEEEQLRIQEKSQDNEAQLRLKQIEALQAIKDRETNANLEAVKLAEKNEELRIHKTSGNFRFALALAVMMLLVLIGFIFLAYSLGYPALATRLSDFIWPIVGFFIWQLRSIFKSAKPGSGEH